MRGAVVSPDAIVVAELPVFAAAAVAAALAASAAAGDYAIAAAAADFEGTQSYQCSDYNLAEQLAGATAEIDMASAVEQDFHTEDLTRHSNFEFVGLAGEQRSASKDPQL